MAKIFIFLILISSLFFHKLNAVTIGGIVDSNDAEENHLNALIYQWSANAINENGQDETEAINTHIVKIPFGDELYASKMICKILPEELAAIFGPSSPSTATHIQSICDEKEMPLILTSWNEDIESPFVSLYPHPEAISDIIMDLVKAWGWEQFTILYESAQWLPRSSNLLRMYDAKGHTVTVRQITNSSTKYNYRKVLHEVKKMEDTHIIIDCSIKILPEVLKQAQQVGLMTESHQFIITNLDLHTLDLEPYQYSGTNITGIRIVDPEHTLVKQVTQLWIDNFLGKTKSSQEDYNDRHNFGSQEDDDNDDDDDGDEDGDEEEEYVPSMLTAEKLPTSTALIYDGLLLFAAGYNKLNLNNKVDTVPLSCDEKSSWETGFSLSNYIRTSNVRGLTKQIKFDHSGYRKEFELDIVEIASEGLIKVGTWNNTQRLKMSRLPEPPVPKDEGSMKNVTLRVLTAISAPYGMLKEQSLALTGNDRFEGYAIELIESLAELLSFNFTFILQHDKKYGSRDAVTGQWDGMTREIIDGRADLAIVDLTITAEREADVDFTMPFMNLGISLLYRVPSKQSLDFFSFVSPFSLEVWLYVLLAIFSVSLTLFILGRISPGEWDNPYPCIEEPDTLENQFSFRNAMWFTMGAHLQQGSDLAPKSTSTRIIASIWCFFTLIMVSSYTANLAAFLTLENTVYKIKSVDDLYKMKGAIKYGAKRSGSTMDFFKGAEHDPYKGMYEYMMEHPELLTDSNEEGIEMVKTMDYAYFMESTSIEYTIERECNVTRVGGNLDEKGYGIAMRKGYEYRNILSEAVLRLQEQGKLTEMYTKWWKEKRGGGLCGKTKSSDAKGLQMENVGGVFFVVGAGSLVATFIGIIELIYVIWRNARNFKTSLKQEFIDEIKFIMKFQENTRTLRQRKSMSNSSGNSEKSLDTESTNTSKQGETSRIRFFSDKMIQHP